MAAPVFAPLSDWLADNKLKNWAGNLQYSTSKLDKANSVKDVQELIKKYDKVKVLGTRHCFNTIADSKHNLDLAQGNGSRLFR